MPGRRKQGFTLIEILVVVAIIATLASVVVLTLGEDDEARGKGEVGHQHLRDSLEAFRLDVRRYPTRKRGWARSCRSRSRTTAGTWRGPT